jgi:ferredoxin
MKAMVDDSCIGCELCVNAVPTVFEMGDDGLAHAKVDTVPEDKEDAVQEAADSCPSESIQVED